ncbi:MAG: nuclear transport factor 2 family protein [Bacteroidota bacterium]
MKALITQFYESFQALDAEGMVDCYHPDIHFEDPAFGVLEGQRAGNMWRMLCQSQKGKGFQLTFSNVAFENGKGQALWEARYTFSKTGRKVHNIIQAEFEFKEGQIIRHIDRFDLYRWSRQAMGASGYLIGWSGFFQKKLQAQTNRLLERFEEGRR